MVVLLAPKDARAKATGCDKGMPKVNNDDVSIILCTKLELRPCVPEGCYTCARFGLHDNLHA